MADETINGAAGAAAPAPSLEDTIGATYDKLEKGDAAPGASSPAADAAPAGDGRARDANGRFAAKDGEAADATAADPKAAAAVDPAAPAVDPAAAVPADVEPLQQWPADIKAKFATLPAEAKPFAIEMAKGFQAAHERRVAELGPVAAVAKVLEPINEALKANGHTPESWVTMARDTQMAIMRDPVATIAELAKIYRADPGKLAQALGIQTAASAPAAAPAAGAAAPAAAAAGEAGWVDPQLRALLKPLEDELASLKTDAQTRQEQERAAAFNGAVTQITQFAAAKDGQGNPLHPLYAEVEADMVRLGAAERQSGRTPDLQQLYDTAVWANPSTREKQLAQVRAAESQRIERERTATATKARAASASVVGAPGAVTRSVKGGTLEEQISARYDELAGQV